MLRLWAKYKVTSSVTSFKDNCWKHRPLLLLQQIVKTSCAWECVTSLLTANKFVEVVLSNLVLGVSFSSTSVAEENPRAIPTRRDAKHATRQHVATRNTRSRACKTLWIEFFSSNSRLPSPSSCCPYKAVKRSSLELRRGSVSLAVKSDSRSSDIF